MDNPNGVIDIPRGFRIFTQEEKDKLKSLNLGMHPHKFLRMCICNHETGKPSGWKIGCSGVCEDITYIIDIRFQFNQFYEDIKKLRDKGKPVYLK